MHYPENTQRAVALFEKIANFAKSNVDRALEEFGTVWLNDVENMLARLYPSQVGLEAAIKGYRSFAIDSMRRQKKFEIELAYPPKTFEEASNEIYLNPGYMTSQYLPGLLLSHYLWVHHYQQINYYREFFIAVLRLRGARDFAEVGVGTGIYSRMLLEALPAICGVGIDISPLSLEFARSHIASYGFSDRYKVINQDITTKPPGQKFQAAICVEVLEHLEDPVEFLRSLKSIVAPEGRLFVTAALNAAHADHIYLYRTPQEVVNQVCCVGFHIENMFLSNAYAPSRPGLPVPGALAMILTNGR